MTDYQQFLQERDQIDFLLQKGYKINTIKENLSGAIIEFTNSQEKDTKTLHLLTADGRKYIVVKLILQRKSRVS